MSNDEAPRREPPEAPPLFVVKGAATAEEVAALVAVLQSTGSADPTPARRPSEWSAHHRKVRSCFPSGAGGWRSSSLPR